MELKIQNGSWEHNMKNKTKITKMLKFQVGYESVLLS